MIDIADISAEEIARLVGEAGFSGVVSLAPLGSGASLDVAFGLAERSHKVPNTVTTRFAMASGCKIFTAVAVGLLIQEGKIGLDTPLADCVRSRQFHFGSAVTIGQLLTIQRASRTMATRSSGTTMRRYGASAPVIA